MLKAIDATLSPRLSDDQKGQDNYLMSLVGHFVNQESTEPSPISDQNF